MPGSNLIRWMYEEEHSVGYVARRSGIAAARLIELLAGAGPTGDEVSALANLTGMKVDELQVDAPASASGTSTDPLHCYTVAEAAALLQVSPDTVRKEVKAGTLHHVVLGERALRIPRYAIEDRLGGSGPPARDDVSTGGRVPEDAGHARSTRGLSDIPTAPSPALF